jgi:hypothetical protein
MGWAQVNVNESDLNWPSSSPQAPVWSNDRLHSPVAQQDENDSQASAVWSIETSDATLSNTLSRWCRQEKWQLIWEAERDFPILVNMRLKGSFQSAILTVMTSLTDTDYPLQAVLHSDTRVIRIVRRMQATNN